MRAVIASTTTITLPRDACRYRGYNYSNLRAVIAGTTTLTLPRNACRYRRYNYSNFTS